MSKVDKNNVEKDIVDVLVLSNDTWRKGRNAANNADVNIDKVNSSDRIEYASVPQVTADPAAGNDLTRKSWVDTQLGNKQSTSEKNQANGYAGVGADGKIPSGILPSYVDDVLEYANLAAFPVTGESEKIYIAIDTKKIYRWSGTIYVEISPSPGTTDDVTEGVTNLYFTDARAKAAAVSDSIIDEVTDVAPSQNAVYDALAGKQATGNYITSLTGEATASGPGAASTTLSNAAVIAKVLTGFAASAGIVAATDSILQAFQKVVGNYYSRFNRITLLSPQAGTSTEYTTLQAAFNAIPAATTASEAKQTHVLIIPAGEYDEDITYQANNRRVVVVCLGTVTLGVMTGSSWGSGGTPRNFIVANDGTATVNSIRTGFAVVGIDQVGDGFSTHQAYLNAKFRISGNLSFTSAIGISSEFMLGGVEVFGNFDTTGYSGNCNVYMKNSRIRGTAGGTSAPLRLQRAENCQFDGLLTVAVYGILEKCVIAAGVTTAAAAGDFAHQGFINCNITGTFTGPVGSAKFDLITNYWFVTNAASLAGGATKTLLYNLGFTPATAVAPSTNQTVYVNALTGNDSNSGSYEAPFATVQAALASITDATQTKPYVIQLGANRQIETGDVFLKPYVFIKGQGQRATYFRINSGSLKPHSSFGTGSGWTGLFDLYYGGSSTISWDLQALGGSDSTFVIQNCTLSGNLNFKGRSGGGGDYLEMYVGIILGTLTLDSYFYQIQSIDIGGAVSVTNSQNRASLSGSWFKTGFENNVTIDASGGTITAYKQLAQYSTAANTLTTVGTVNLQVDSKSLPPKTKQTLSIGTTVTFIDDCSTLSFTPAVVGDWTTSPEKVDEALDELASRLTDIPTLSHEQEKYTIDAQIVSDQFIELAHPVLNTKVIVWIVGGIPQEPTVDYTIANNGTGGVGKLSFVGGGTLAGLIAGQKIIVDYIRG